MDRRAFLENPYRPGAGHVPPFMAGREIERNNFKRVIRQTNPTDNFLITGLRGFGKTVLLESLRQMAEAHDWIWVGNDLSETSSLSEERLALRILTDLAQAIATKLNREAQAAPPPLAGGAAVLDGRETEVFAALKGVYETSPGLPSDRLKSVLGRAAGLASRVRASGIVLAYDEAQCLSDHAERDEFPMSMLVETVGALQKREAVVPIILVLSGLPQVQDALTETRTYTERMFHVMTLERLSREETWDALEKPIAKLAPPLHVSKELLHKVVELSGGYPYLIQFFGKELVEKLLENGGTLPVSGFPAADTLDRLDNGLFGARWNKTTDKQREILGLIANRDRKSGREFTAQEVAAINGSAGFTSAQASQLLHSLCERGLLYRTRHGHFAFTVPMSERMIQRRLQSDDDVADSWLEPDEEAPRKKGWLWFR